jgi:hypothetical protein
VPSIVVKDSTWPTACQWKRGHKPCATCTLLKGIPEQELYELIVCIEKHRARPWNKTDTELLRKQAEPVRQRLKRLQAVLKDYQTEAKFLSSYVNHKEPWRAANLVARLRIVKKLIAALETEAEHLKFNNFYFWNTDYFGTRKTFTPAQFMARDIGRHLLIALRAVDAAAGRQLRTRLNKAGIKFAMEQLDGCLPATKLPDRDSISRVLRKLWPR